MDFVAIVDQVIMLLRQRGRMTYRTLQRQFQLDDDALHDLTEELLYAYPEVHDDTGRGFVWTGDAGPAATAAPGEPSGQAPLAYTPPYLAEKILTSRSALEGERKQVTVLFADLKGSMELLADRDPEEARQLLDPVLERLMAAVRAFRTQCDQAVAQDAAVQAYVRQLEQDYDATEDETPRRRREDDFNPEQLMHELEDFLRQERDRGAE